METVLSIIYNIRPADVIDVIVVAFFIYKILQFIKETRAEQLVKGLLLLLFLTKISEWLKLYTVNFILRNTMTLGMIALIIVFQPELRRALEYIGRGSLVSKYFVPVEKDHVTEIKESISNAVAYLKQRKTGALIIIERETGLSEVADTGSKLNAHISEELLINLFNTNAPLHDGAVIIRGDRLLAAGCVLPLSHNKNLSKNLGTRHRAGIGITENSDAVAIIISEETGDISVAIDGKLSRFLDVKSIERIVLNIYESQSSKSNALVSLLRKIGRKKDE